MQNRVTSLTINKLQVWHAISNRNSNTRLRYMTNEFSINGAIAIYKGEEIFMTLSHFSLLKLIEKEGSINAAAKAKGIPYQQAWNLIDQMNKISPIPIVVRQKGGNGGGGCIVSKYGKNVIKLFEHKLKLFKKAMDEMNEDMQTCLL